MLSCLAIASDILLFGNEAVIHQHATEFAPAAFLLLQSELELLQ